MMETADSAYCNPAFEGDGKDAPAVPVAEERDGPPKTPVSRKRVVKNVVAISCAFTLHFTAYFGAANLQSSVNASEGLGTASLVAVYAALISSSFFLPGLVIRRLGCKWTMFVSLVMYMPYIAAQFHATSATLLPTAVLVGLGGGPLWCSKCTYLSHSAREYSAKAAVAADTVTVRFFGIFFVLFPLSNVFGNVITSLVLQSEASDPVEAAQCGADFCPWMTSHAVENPNLRPPPESQIFALNGVFLGCMALAAAIVAFVVDPVQRQDDGQKLSGFRLVTASARLLLDPVQILVMPVTVFFGISQGFMSADFTQAYVSCAWGIPHIGLVLMCYGAANSVFAVAVSWLSKTLGRRLVICTASFCYAGLLVALLLWKPDPHVSTVPFFLIAALWGVTDSTFLVVNASYGILFRGDEEASYSNFRVWEGVGFIAAYAYSPHLCSRSKIILMIVITCVAGVCYLIGEIVASRRPKTSFSLQDSLPVQVNGIYTLNKPNIDKTPT